ncbi:MAG TPA: T9SS type A sorting domain-containing protein [Flavobacteriia bacterium]|nr:T9SS type A sorting domain-containing protein [Flavobacteriia bacterium]
MSIKSISTSNNLTITTVNNKNYLIEIRTFLGTTVFKDTVKPNNNTIQIKGLNPGKYIIHISNDANAIKQQIHIKK